MYFETKMDTVIPVTLIRGRCIPHVRLKDVGFLKKAVLRVMSVSQRKPAALVVGGETSLGTSAPQAAPSFLSQNLSLFPALSKPAEARWKHR